MKVIHVLGSLNRGGVETWLLNVLRHMDSDSIRMDFLCLSGEEGVYAPEINELGSNVFAAKLTKNLQLFNRQFNRLLKEQEYCVVHSHVHHFSGYILRQSSKMNVPIRIAHSHSVPVHNNLSLARQVYLWQMQNWIRRYATDGLGVSSEAMSGLFGDDWKKDQRYKVLHCGVDLDRFKYNVHASHIIRNRYRIPSDAKVVGHVGRFAKPKNHQFLLKVAETVGAQEENVWFLLVGDGPLRIKYEDQVRRHSIPRVVFAGDQSDIAGFLSAMDLFLFPSLWEGLPLAVIEAQAAGLRCVCSDRVTKEVAVVPGAVQFLYLDLPIIDWVQTILSMMAMPRVNTEQSQPLFESTFSIESSVQALSHIYCKDRN